MCYYYIKMEVFFMEWEMVTFQEPALTIGKNHSYIYLNSTMRDIISESKMSGIDFF